MDIVEQYGARRWGGGDEARVQWKDEGGKTREGGGDGQSNQAQVLLLMHPGAELGRAVLSETLPSCEAGDVCARA